MKLPKTFVPDKELENKIKQLLEGVDDNPIFDDDSLIDTEAEKLFPNFIKYLKSEYGNLIIEKDFDSTKKEWSICLPKKGGGKIPIGDIQVYKEEIGPTTEYGYKADIVIQEIYKKLLYRTSYQGYDSLGSIVFEEDPCRYDSENIPFP